MGQQGTQVFTGTTSEREAAAFTGGLLRVGEDISGWTVTRLLGIQSGEADIFIAEKDGKKGVIKYYRGMIKPKMEILEKLKELNHPDIVNVFEFGHYNNHFYEIMEYAEGGALDSRKDDGKTFKYLPLPEEPTAGICREIINAYKACHEKNIIHRDIKPANIYYRGVTENEDGSFTGSDIVVADFGISSIMDEMAKLHKTQTASRTTGYAAPEVLSGLISPKMDYYALGITLWELLTGKNPFETEEGRRRNDAHLIRDTIEGRMADDILSREPKLSEKMQRLIRGLLVVDPEHRWGYDEVSSHLDGKEVPVWEKAKKKFMSFEIGETTCASLEQIAGALIKNLENAEVLQKFIYRGLLVGFLEEDYPDYAEKIQDIAEVYSAKGQNENGIFKIALLLNPEMPFPCLNGYTLNNLEGIISLLENAPESIVPLLRDVDSKLYIYFDALGLSVQAAEIRAGVSVWTDVELAAKAQVILMNKIIRPFKLERYANVELSEIDQIRKIPTDMQNRLAAMVVSRSYEGLFIPWLELVSGVKLRAFRGGWKELITLIDAMAKKPAVSAQTPAPQSAAVVSAEDQYQAGLTLMKKGKADEALSLLEKAAAAGHASAKTMLGALKK